MEEVEGQRIKLVDDVMINILKRLAAKSLLRLKCVSKSWYSLINSSCFISMHYNYDSLSNHFIFLKCYQEIEESTDSIYYNGHCNGIVCIASYRGIVLYNLTLREFWDLPPSILPPLANLSPSKELSYSVDMTIGIGFDTNTNDYKVVRILDPGQEYEFEDFENNRKYVSKVEVYNLSTNCWRRLEDLQCLLDSFHCSHVLFNRAYHWLGYLEAGGNLIICFDFSTESFQKMSYPEGIASEGRESLFVLNQTLALIFFTENYPREVLAQQSIDIWVMKKYGVRESWIKEFTVGPILIKAPLSIWKNDTELMIESKEGKLVSYNFLFQSMEDLHISGVVETLEAVVCKQSLISIKKERKKWS